jgi:putative DNA primase/helicase
MTDEAELSSNILKFAKLQEDDSLVPPEAEDAIALAFAERHADALRYVAAWGKWFHYDDVRWAADTTLHTFDMVRDICREVAGNEDDKRVASAKTVAAVATLARADRRIAAAAEQWDANSWLLTGIGQTIDLRTGTARDPDPLDYITKKAACDCAPLGAAHPLWTAFLERVTDRSTELQSFLQRYIGYCCTGFTQEHVFVFAHGTGANGKSTFVNTVSGILGDYATIADTGTFIASHNERHPTDVAKLVGARLVVAQETQHGRRWDEAKIKSMTGGDRVTARYMRQDFFDFTPNYKLLISGNHKPRLASVDEAMRRRLLLVPFTVQIPPAERDPKLVNKLKAEWPAILRWMVNGALEWQRIGLKPPPVVLEATESYFSDQDIIGQWMADCVVTDDPLTVTASQTLYQSWKTWCEERGFPPGSVKRLSEALSDRGHQQKRTKTTRGFVLKLQTR